MAEIIKVKVTSTGRYLPPKVLTNKDLEKIVDTSDEWIRTRTGICQRHIAERGVGASQLGLEAARIALDKAGLAPGDVDCVLVATGTPDYYAFPNTASIIQDALKAKGAAAMDLSAACSGSVYGLAVGSSLVACGEHKNLLFIGAEVMSSILNWDDRDTCVLFGDGAGAMVLQPAAEGEGEILGHHLAADGSGGKLLIVPGGGSRNPPSAETLEKKMHAITMDGTAVFKYAVKTMSASILKVMDKCGVKAEDVKLIIPHQANDRITFGVAKWMNLPPEKFLSNIKDYGNTMSATTLIGLDEAIEQGRLKSGDLVVLAVFGAGFTTGASLIRL